MQPTLGLTLTPAMPFLNYAGKSEIARRTAGLLRQKSQNAFAGAGNHVRGNQAA